MFDKLLTLFFCGTFGFVFASNGHKMPISTSISLVLWGECGMHVYICTDLHMYISQTNRYMYICTTCIMQSYPPKK